MPKRKVSRKLLIALATVAAVAVVGVTVIGVNLTTPPQAAPRPTPTVSPTPTVPPTPVPSIIPADCTDIYTRDWATELAPFVLNPAWSQTQPQSDTSNDPVLKKLIAPNIQLTCQWGKAAGGSDSGIITSLAQISPETEAMVKAQFNALGWTCFDVSGGVRCITEAQDPNGSWGESHFLREGTWIATRWSNLAPDGYTADIIATLWK